MIAIVLYVQRLHLLSFPSLFLGVTFLFTCSPLILYELQGTNAFRLWEWVDTPSVLVAMPVVMLAFSSFHGGTSYETGTGLAADVAGAIYITGYSSSVNMPTGPVFLGPPAAGSVRRGV